MQPFIPYENHANAALRRREKNLFFFLLNYALSSEYNCKVIIYIF